MRTAPASVLRLRTAILLAAGLCAAVSAVRAQDQKAQPPQTAERIAGTFAGWNVPVPLSNYHFIKNTILVFGTRWGASPQTEQELDDRVWEQLVLSYEAFRRNIQVTDQELEEELGKMLASEKVAFDWKKDTEAFAKWVQEKTRGTPELLKNQLRHLIQLENLRKAVLDTFKPAVTEEEARLEFINEYNTIELELVQFDERKDAEAFYRQMQDPALWEAAAKREPKKYQHPGFVSFEFLINMWQLPKDDLYKMLEMKINAVYPPIPIYKGYGVCRILKIRKADPAEFPKVRDAYLKQVEMIKKYEELKAWLARLKEEAQIKLYREPQAAGQQQ